MVPIRNLLGDCKLRELTILLGSMVITQPGGASTNLEEVTSRRPLPLDFVCHAMLLLLRSGASRIPTTAPPKRRGFQACVRAS